jgi:GNAT superfamily N-acetyltransferase
MNLYDIFPEAHEGKFDDSANTVWFNEFQNGDLVGTCNAEERGPGVWYFSGGIVKPEYRRQGIFRKLHNSRTQYVKNHGARILFVASSPMNRQLFIDEGWITITRYPYHEEFDEVVFFRCIDE